MLAGATSASHYKPRHLEFATHSSTSRWKWHRIDRTLPLASACRGNGQTCWCASGVGQRCHVPCVGRFRQYWSDHARFHSPLQTWDGPAKFCRDASTGLSFPCDQRHGRRVLRSTNSFKGSEILKQTIFTRRVETTPAAAQHASIRFVSRSLTP